MTSLKTSIKTITYLSDIGCLEIQGASLEGEFEVGLQLLSFPEVQQAVATYWDRALTKYDYSLQAKYHNRMAVEVIFKQLQVQRQRESSAM